MSTVFLFLKANVWLQVNVKAKSAFNNKLFALNVVISIPVPDNTAKADIQTTQGTLQPMHSGLCMATWLRFRA